MTKPASKPRREKPPDAKPCRHELAYRIGIFNDTRETMYRCDECNQFLRAQEIEGTPKRGMD